MSVIDYDDPEYTFMVGSEDRDESWKDWCPDFEWLPDDLEEFEHDKRCAENERLAMAGWWEMEGVRCYTFNRNPQQNPYLKEGERL
jgi:hypothetical protein